jgi:maltoporin
MKFYPLCAVALAAALLAATTTAFADASAPETNEKTDESSSVPSQAQPQLDIAEAAAKKAVDALGIVLWGYGRGGFYGSSDGAPKGQYQLGGDLQHYRLGNEGDNYLEFGIGKKWNLNGVKLGTYWMPNVYNGTVGTAQLYTDLTGLSFAPGITLWAGQRYHRIQDIHILDNWVMQDGDNYGAGVDGIKLGGGALNVAVYSDGSSGNLNADPNNAKRGNLQWRDIPVSPGGTLNLTAAWIRGDFSDRKNSNALGLLYNQKILADTTTNSLFVQGSNGHSDITGEFYNLGTASSTSTSKTTFTCTVALNPDGTCPVADLNASTTTTTTPGTPLPGAGQFRIIESINWQAGLFGGQALIGYQTVNPDDTHLKVKDFSAGGRVTYGVARNIKLIGESGYTTRSIDNAETQHLYKATAAVAFAPNTDFWTRPELRVYVNHAAWNNAAALANSATFGANGRTNATTFGVQVEAWWE